MRFRAQVHVRYVHIEADIELSRQLGSVHVGNHADAQLHLHARIFML